MNSNCQRGTNPNPVTNLIFFNPFYFSRISSPSPRCSWKTNPQDSIIINAENRSNAIP
uniref:KEG n=1 Tax=Arundo donax TaxID=35708 RepID=A0A0A9CKG8_ARUDO